MWGEEMRAAIEGAADNGGGRVVVPAGVYPTGSLHLRSNVELFLRKGAVIRGGCKPEDYDCFPEEVCPIRPENSRRVMVYAYDEENVAITGEGSIEIPGKEFFDTVGVTVGCFPKPPIERPRLLQLYRCNNVRLEGVTLKDSPCWTCFIRLCNNLYINGLTITADQRMINNDGIDIDGCKHVRVSNCNIRTCDDCLILRAMRESADEHVVCEDVVVENCVLTSRCQPVRLGCPSDDTIRDAFFRNIVAEATNGIFADYPARYLRPDDEGYMDISNITFENYTGKHSLHAVQIVSEHGVKIRRADGFVFRNFDVISQKPIRFIGNKDYEIGNVTLENFVCKVIDEGEPMVVRGIDGLNFKNVTLNGISYPDGLVEGAAGSTEPLRRPQAYSWEATKQTRK